jgi:gluconate:H+ symporter, GntP family
VNPVLLLIISIAAIVLLSARYHVNPFLLLVGLAVVVGLLAGLPADTVLTHLRAGFGHTLEKIGLLIIFGTILGSLLDHTGGTRAIADFVLRRAGANQTPVAVVLIGFLIGLPIFCDSGFIILSGLVLSIAAQSGQSPLRLVLCLAGSLYAVHCLVPPHPGITAAAGLLSADTGQLILFGTILAIPGTVVSLLWANYADRNKTVNLLTDRSSVSESLPAQSLPTSLVAEPALPVIGVLPAPGRALLAVLLPIVLIAAKPLLLLNADDYPAPLLAVVRFVGDPLVALAVGMVLAATLAGGWKRAVFNNVLNDAIHKAGPVLVIVGAGGAFGEVIRHIGLETVIGQLATRFGGGAVPLWLPFLLTAVLKTAQGSSTVAVMTVASILQPLLQGLGVDTDWDKLLVLGAMGAGSMSVSHANDAYFWVVSRFGHIDDTALMLRTYSVQSALMGVVTFGCLWLIQWLF